MSIQSTEQEKNEIKELPSDLNSTSEAITDTSSSFISKIGKHIFGIPDNPPERRAFTLREMFNIGAGVTTSIVGLKMLTDMSKLQNRRYIRDWQEMFRKEGWSELMNPHATEDRLEYYDWLGEQTKEGSGNTEFIPILEEGRKSGDSMLKLVTELRQLGPFFNKKELDDGTTVVSVSRGYPDNKYVNTLKEGGDKVLKGMREISPARALHRLPELIGWEGGAEHMDSITNYIYENPIVMLGGITSIIALRALLRVVNGVRDNERPNTFDTWKESLKRNTELLI